MSVVLVLSHINITEIDFLNQAWKVVLFYFSFLSEFKAIVIYAILETFSYVSKFCLFPSSLPLIEFIDVSYFYFLLTAKYIISTF